LSHLGEIFALCTACLWVATSINFEEAGKLIGSLTLNFIRLIFAFLFLTAVCTVFRGMPLPLDAGPAALYLLSLSALSGFLIGDFCLFSAFVMIGARRSLLVMSLAPPLAALISISVLGEILGAQAWLGIGLTVGGVMAVVAERPNGNSNGRNITVGGWLLALGGAIGQAVGLVFSKMGIVAYAVALGTEDPGIWLAFSATQIRVIAGALAFAVVISIGRKWPRIFAALKNRPAMKYTGWGAFFGPFLGVTGSLLAVQFAEVGVAGAIMSIMPVLIIPVVYFLRREKVSTIGIIGACAAVTGVAVLFLR
jgi:drug/metabolite transporter (DMT)-like permease